MFPSRRLSLLVALALVAAPAPAATGGAGPPVSDRTGERPPGGPLAGAGPRNPHLFIIGIGASHWSDVHDLDPSGSPFSDQLGRFHTWGFCFELGYQRRVARLGNVDLLAGADLGFFGSENSRRVDAVLLPFGGNLEGRLAARGIYLTPSVRLVLAGGGRWRFAVGGGAGYYAADIVQQLEDGFESAELFKESELGGYVSIGLDRRLSKRHLRWRLRVEQKSHFADFGSAADYAPQAGELAGPIHTLLIGAVYDR